MLSSSSIWAVVLRHVRLWKRNPNILLMGFYWPLLDILVWGFLGSWIQRAQVAEFHNYEAAALLGILLWQVIGRGCNIMGVAFAEELWANNILNLFSLPLRTAEWILGIVLFYGIMIGITSAFCIAVIPLLYSVSLWYIISTFLIFSPPLILSALWVGFTCLQIIALFGRRGTELGFIAGWFLLPFCGAYYPIEILPEWGQAFSAFLPMSYVFRAMRGYVMHQQDPTALLIKGYLLGFLYAVGAVMLFVYCFNRAKRKGLARLVD